MRRPLILCCWPGLPRLWVHGDWSGLFLAAAFGAWLNFLLVGSLVWPGLTGPVFPWMAWPLTVLGWGLSAWLARSVEDGSEDGLQHRGPDTLFIRAQSEYLKGNWRQVEAVLLRVLRYHPRDVEARLLLTTVFRRTGRLDKARRQLEWMKRMDASRSWRHEIDRETRYIERDAIQTESETQRQDSRREEDRTVQPTRPLPAAAGAVPDAVPAPAPDGSGVRLGRRAGSDSVPAIRLRDAA